MNCNLTRREFIRNAVMLAGAGFTVPLWAAMKYDRDAVMRYFRESEEAMNARVKAGIEANRKGEFHVGRGCGEEKNCVIV